MIHPSWRHLWLFSVASRKCWTPAPSAPLMEFICVNPPHSSLVSGWVRMLSLGMKPESKCGPYLVLGSKTGKTGFFFQLDTTALHPCIFKSVGHRALVIHFSCLLISVLVLSSMFNYYVFTCFEILSPQYIWRIIGLYTIFSRNGRLVLLPKN